MRRAMQSMKVLIANVGSTSFKFKLFDMPGEKIIASGKIERVGQAKSPMAYKADGKEEVRQEIVCPDQKTSIQTVLELLTGPKIGVLRNLNELAAVGLKTVHARGINDCVRVDGDVLQRMEEYTPLCPAHNPPYILACKLFLELLPGKPVVGVFEPHFHKTIPDFAYTYGIPQAWAEKYSIRKYGFHGASHRYVSERVPQLLGLPKERLKIISCHLGGSSSLCAIKNGFSVDTSMGFSAQSGLDHAQRCGDIDPFLIPFIMDKEKLTTEEVRKALCKNSGLAGISGVPSGDFRDLEEAANKGNTGAKRAIEVFAYQIIKFIGMYSAVLEGVEVIAFAGGIGENRSELRAKVCRSFGYLGLALDIEKNQTRGEEVVISTEDSRVKVVVIKTNEELIVARETVRVATAR
jgi:acetate kinase